MNHVLFTQSRKAAKGADLGVFAPLRDTLLFMLIAVTAACLLAAAGCGTPRGYDADLTPGNGEEWADWGDAAAGVQSVTQRRQDAEVRKAIASHLAKEPWCAWCGVTNGLQVHHIWPISRRPDLAAADANLITLCRQCHFVVGHKRNWSRAVWNLRPVIESALDAGPRGGSEP